MCVTLDFHKIKTRYRNKPIRNCPGRFILHRDYDELPLHKILSLKSVISEFESSSAQDTVLVAAIEGGGMISYRKSESCHVHTLNTEEGFLRKLHDLGISF